MREKRACFSASKTIHMSTNVNPCASSDLRCMLTNGKQTLSDFYKTIKMSATFVL